MDSRSMPTLMSSPPPPHGGRSSRRRRGPGEEPDRISALPDEMLLLVLARLHCVRTAVQTGLLSRRWRGLWTGLTDLAFCRLAPATIEAVLARFAPSTVVSLCDVAHHDASVGNSLLRSAARLSPEKLVFTVLEPHRNNGATNIELPCFPSTKLIELNTQYLCVKPPPAESGEFTALECLSISGRIVGLGDLLNRCPRLRFVSVRAAILDKELLRVTPPPVGEFTTLESLSLAGRIDGLGSFLNRCRHLRVLSVTYMDSQLLTLPSYSDFPMLEKLSLSGRIVGLGELLNRCPRLRFVSVRTATLDHELLRVTPPPVRELTSLESLSLAGRIYGLGSFLNRCRHLRVLDVTYMDSRQLTLPLDGEFPVLEKLSLSGNIDDLGTLLTRCPRLRLLSVTFRGVALDSIEAALAALDEVVPLGLTVCLLGIDDIHSADNLDAARFTSLLRSAARASPQEFAFKHFFDKYNSVHLPSFHNATSMDMDLNASIRFRRIPEAAADFSALERLSLSGACRPVNLATMVSRCKRLRELSVSITNGKIKVHSASLQKLYASTGGGRQCRSIDIVTPMLRQLKLEVREGGDINLSISAPTVEKVWWERLHVTSASSVLGFWRLQCLRLETAQDTCSLRVLYLRISASKHSGADLVFTKEMETLLITDFSVLELHLENTSGHLFGALVLGLFGIHRIRAATKRLKIIRPCNTLLARRSCPVSCPCDETKHRANQDISSTCLEEVEMANFSGHQCEHDFLSRILGCSPMLKRVSLNLSPSGTCTKRVKDILLAYPSVSCYAYYSSGKLAQCISG